jgi:hypothetical protein
MMRTLLPILAVCVLTLGAAQAQDCQLKLYDSMELDVANNHVLLPVTLGDAHKEFALKFGNALNGISQNTVTELGLRIRSIDPNVSVVRDQVHISQLARVPQFQLGNVPLNNLELIVLPPEANSDNFDGDLGIHIFSKADFELDIAGKKFNLFSQDHCPGKVVYWRNSGVAQIPFVWQEAGYVRPIMQLDGRQVRVAFDPNGHSQIGMNAMKRLFGLDVSSTELTLVGKDERGRKLFRYPFKTLVADGLTILTPDIRVVDEPPGQDCSGHLTMNFPDPPPLHSTEQPQLATCTGGGDVELGYSVLSKLHMYFALKEKLLYLTATEGH